jgi:hypothetical protein
MKAGLLQALLVGPNQSLVGVAHGHVRQAWSQRVAQAQAFAVNCNREATQIEKLLDKIVEAGAESVIRTFEKRITGLMRQQLAEGGNSGASPGLIA